MIRAEQHSGLVAVTSVRRVVSVRLPAVSRQMEGLALWWPAAQGWVCWFSRGEAGS